MTSNITPIASASSTGADVSTAGKAKPREHGMTVLRDREAKALISLGMDALAQHGKSQSPARSPTPCSAFARMKRRPSISAIARKKCCRISKNEVWTRAKRTGARRKGRRRRRGSVSPK